MSKFFYELLVFSSSDWHLGTAKNSFSSSIGAICGAFYEGDQIFQENPLLTYQVTVNDILQIAFAAFIGLVVTFIGRKIMTAFWDYLVVPLWKKFLNLFK